MGKKKTDSRRRGADRAGENRGSMSQEELETLRRLVRSAAISVGMDPGNELFNDCCSEAMVTMLQCPPESTFGFRFTRARWAIQHFLTEYRSQIRNDYRSRGSMNVEETVLGAIWVSHVHDICVRELTKDERVVFALSVFTDMTVEKIAETVEFSQNHVRNLFRRGREKVRCALVASGDVPKGVSGSCSATT